MAEKPPTPEKARVLLTDKKVAPADLDRYGDTFLENDRPNIAVMFYERTKTPDRVRRVVDRAVKDGDAFLMEWAARVSPDAVSREDWLRCGEEASGAGKFSFARAAFLKAGDAARAAEANNALRKAFDAAPAPPGAGPTPRP